METEADPAFTPEAAWDHARTLLNCLISAFGLPHQIAAMVLLTRKTRTHILQWLTAAEALARRILLIHAAALPKPNAQPPGKAKHLNTKASHGRAGFASDDSEKWSVSFQILPPRRIARGRKRDHRAKGTKHPDARAIAERIEALIRVCAAPEAYAQRLARRLYADPPKAIRIAKPIKRTSSVNPAYTMLCEAQPFALAAANIFRNSS